MFAFSCTREVAFSDTDAAGVAHFSRILVFIEDAEHSWLREQGFDLETQAWPRVKVEISYHKALTFGDRIELRIHSVSVGNSSLTYHCDVRCEDELSAAASFTVVRLGPKGDKCPFDEPERLRLTEE